MQQTEAHVASNKHLITRGEEDAITMSQGHSREVAEKFYQMKSMEEAAVTAAQTHQNLYGIQAVPDLSSDEDEEYVPEQGEEDDEDDENDDDDDEQQQQQQRVVTSSPKRRRLSWTVEEEQWIVRWITKHLKSPEFNKKINWQLCLKHLRLDPLVSHFPEEHLDHTKIMECAKRMAKKKDVTVIQMCQSPVI